MAGNRGKGGSAAELLILGWLQSEGWTVHRAAATGVTKVPGRGFVVKSHDLFGCLDLLAIRRSAQACLDEEETWAIQVTTASGKSARRRKLESVSWPLSWRVSLVSHERTPDPANRARSLDFVKVEDLVESPGGSSPVLEWASPVAVPFDAKRTEAERKARAKAAKEARAAKRKPKTIRHANPGHIAGDPIVLPPPEAMNGFSDQFGGTDEGSQYDVPPSAPRID